MPPKGFKTVTIKDEIYGKLSSIAQECDVNIPTAIGILIALYYRKITVKERTSYADFVKFKGLESVLFSKDQGNL